MQTFLVKLFTAITGLVGVERSNNSGFAVLARLVSPVNMAQQRSGAELQLSVVFDFMRLTLLLRGRQSLAVQKGPIPASQVRDIIFSVVVIESKSCVVLQKTRWNK